ncbi:MAG: LamG-like jellyroll fold domain-containing protein, partial [Planctomycetota bacterium]
SRRALVTDFGVVKAIQAQTQITVTGTVMGTADYIAPEQARGQDIDARADLYAMGVLIYQMLSGRLPFQAESATSMMFQHAYEPPPPLAEVAPDVPGPLADIVMKLMAKKPEERYQSADELLADLHTIRLMPAAAGYKPQTNIVKAPEYDATPQLPVDLVRFVPTGWLSRLRNRVVDLFGAHAPQVVQRMQTTGQQVDGTIAEYERQREQLAKLAEEAKSLAADLERQANSHANAAQMAAQRAEATPRTTAKHTALKQRQESEQAAAELAQLAAEQQQQCEDIEMRLTKLNTILVQLRSQRNVLNARLNAARAHLKAGGARPSQWRPSKRLVYVPITLLLACIIAAMTYVLWPAAEAEEGLIAHWKFDEGGGYTAYDSVGNNHGTIHGAKWVTGEFGTALSFNGVDDYVDTTDFTLPESFSISLWINTSSNRDDQCFIAKNHPGGRGGDNIFIFGFYEGEFHVRIRNSAHLEGTITEGWQCLTAVAEQLDSEHTNITLYRQGKVLWTKIFDDVVGNMSGKPWTIGQEWDGFRRTDFFKGKIDDVKIYGRALSAEQIERLYQSRAAIYQKPSASSGLIAHWKFDEGSGSIAYDSVGKNQGAVHGAAWTTGRIGGALNFDGADDYVDVDDDSALGFGQYDSFSISFWARPFSGGYVLSKERASAQRGFFGYRISWSDTYSRFVLSVDKSFAADTLIYTSHDTAPGGSWYFVTTVYDNKN